LIPQLETKAEAQEWVSEPYYPSPWMNPHADGWQQAFNKAKDFVSQLTLLE
jgi:beta-glucosidase